MTTRSHSIALIYASFERTNWYDAMTIFSWIKGLKFPFLVCSLNDFDSSMVDERKNLSWSSWLHCFRRFAGAMMRILLFRSAHFWERRIHASIVFPSHTSSASIAHLDSGDWNAKRAASTWCGLRSTWASKSEAENLSRLFDGLRFESSWAKYLAWYLVNTM